MTDTLNPFQVYADAMDTMRAAVLSTPLAPVVTAVTFGQATRHAPTRLQVSLDGPLRTAALLGDETFRTLLGPLSPEDVERTQLHFTFDFVSLQSRWDVTGTDVGTAALLHDTVTRYVQAVRLNAERTVKLHETEPLSDRARAATSSLSPDWRPAMLIGTDVIHPAGPGSDEFSDVFF